MRFLTMDQVTNIDFKLLQFPPSPNGLLLSAMTTISIVTQSIPTANVTYSLLPSILIRLRNRVFLVKFKPKLLEDKIPDLHFFSSTRVIIRVGECHRSFKTPLEFEFLLSSTQTNSKKCQKVLATGLGLDFYVYYYGSPYDQGQLTKVPMNIQVFAIKVVGQTIFSCTNTKKRLQVVAKWNFEIWSGQFFWSYTVSLTT